MDKIIKIITQFFAVLLRPVGRLNFDVDLRSIANGDFSDSLNTRSVTNLGQTTTAREIILGNELVYELETIVLQNRIFRVYINAAALVTSQINIYDANGVLLASPTYLTTGVIAVDLTNFAAAIAAALTLAGQTFNIATFPPVSGTVGYLTLEVTTIPYWNYLVIDVTAVDVILRQEAVDQSLIGEWNLIGSFDLEGESITWWTTQKNLPENLDITLVANAVGVFEITTATPHGRVSNEKVTILGTTTADGEWIITVTSPTTFVLQGSTFAAGWVSGGIVTVNPNGNGELGHAVKNQITATWTYFRMIRSQVFNFVTKHQIDTFCEKDAIKKGYYWTDDYNVPRVIYDRTRVYQNDCLLQIVDPLNTYDYLTLGTEIILQLLTGDFTFSFTGQTQVGGNVLSGNSRYAVRLLTDTLTATDWTFLDNPIPATISEEGGNPFLFLGTPPNTTTGKINNFLVTGNLLGIFKYIELATINYQGAALSGYIVRRELITANTMTLQHTGFELNTQDLDIGTLNQVSLIYNTAKNIDELDGYLILSNLTADPIVDLSDFFASFTFAINRRTVPPSTGSFISSTLATGEYQFSQNVYSKASLMINERYRWGFIAEFKDGSKSTVFWSRDIVINCDATQVGCTAALPDYDITTASVVNPSPYAFYVTWGGYNFNQVINGVRVRDVVKRIYAMRVEVTNPQILGYGFLVAGVSGNEAGAFGAQVTWVDPNNTATGNQFGEFPFVAGINETTLPGIPVDVDYPTSTFVPEINYGSFYDVDAFLGGRQITFQLGDLIYNFSQPIMAIQAYPETVPPYDNDYLAEMDGETVNTVPPLPDKITLDDGSFCLKGASTTVNGNLFSKKLRVTEFPAATVFFDAAEGLVLHTPDVGGFFDSAAPADRGIRLVQYAREKTALVQYGNITDSRYAWTGTLLEIDGNEPATFDVFGGDVFTQKMWFKDRYPTVTVNRVGFGQGFGFYTQNRVNAQMRNYNTTAPAPFPSNAVPQVQTWLNNTVLEFLSYNEGYTIRNGVTSYAAFDPNAEITNDYPVRFIWSAQKAPSSGVDAYRIFLPLNFKDLEYRYGEITHHATGNGELYSWQPRKFERQSFIPNELITTTSGVEVVLGDGSIMKLRPIELSQIGSSDKWAIIKGMGAQGGDTFYYPCKYLYAYARFGYDGDQEISLIHGMGSFFRNNFNIVFDKSTPADNQGIHGWWNNAFKEAITTVRAWRDDIEAWAEPFSVLHNFAAGTGSLPVSDLIEVGGILYGTTPIGGANGVGTIFSFDPATVTYTVLFNFIVAPPNGNTPNSGLTLAANGKLYGTTASGGTNGVGTIYEYNIGTATFTNKINLATATGSLPAGAMTEYLGSLYGMTQTGGVNSLGVIYKYDYTGNIYTDIFDFVLGTGGNLGGNSHGSLTVLGTDLYGMTYRGGVNDKGVIFKFDLTTYTKVYDFGNINGENPAQSLTLLNGILYGLTLGGGLNGVGTLFSFDPTTNTETVLYNFDGLTGQSPLSTLITFGNWLIGTTAFGGTSNFGVIFEFDTITNTLYVIQNFVGASGQDPRSSLVIFNNVLYGMTRNGGSFGTGVLFGISGVYNVGVAVSIGTTTEFEEIPAFYESIIPFNTDTPPSSTWNLVEITNNVYYNFYTFIFSEITNGFDGFISPHPKIAVKWNNSYLTPRPVSNTGTMYEHNRGSYAQWYDDGNTLQAVDGLTRQVLNVNPNETKEFSAVRIRSFKVPSRMNFKTVNQESFLLAADFLEREGVFNAGIKKDSTVTLINSQYGAEANPTGSTEADTDQLRGDYMEVELIFTNGEYQNWFSSIIRVDFSNRRNQT